MMKKSLSKKSKLSYEFISSKLCLSKHKHRLSDFYFGIGKLAIIFV